MEELIVIAVSVIICTAIVIFRLFKSPTETQLEQIKAWLLWAVVEAERELGSGTGRLKLSMVYGLFVEKFTWLARVMPFTAFSRLVDVALEEMRSILESNKAVASIVRGD